MNILFCNSGKLYIWGDCQNSSPIKWQSGEQRHRVLQSASVNLGAINWVKSLQ